MKWVDRKNDREYKGTKAPKRDLTSKTTVDGVLSVRELVNRQWSGIPVEETTKNPMYFGVTIENGLDIIDRHERLNKLQNEIRNYKDKLKDEAEIKLKEAAKSVETEPQN